MVRSMQLRLSHMVRNMLVMLLVGAAAVSSAFGQFEYTYGGDCNDIGTDVKPIRAASPCSGGGYVAVGTTNSLTNSEDQDCLSNTEIYVVRTNAAGARIWEHRYKITSSSNDDRGEAIIELADGSGFVIAGSTIDAANTTADAVLLKIDCDGAVVWAKTYDPSPSGYDYAYDLVEATMGNGSSTSAGDFIVCGTTQTNTYNGLVFRTDNAGALIWSSTVVLGGTSATTDEVLYSVAEAPPTPMVNNGDVVAAGYTTTATAGLDAYVVRLSAHAGRIVGAPQGTATFGGANDDVFNSVKVLTQGQNATNLVFVGWTDSPTTGGTNDIYLVKTPANPCGAPVVQNTIDNVPGGSLNERGADVMELHRNSWFPTFVGNFAVGDLALTGMTEVVVGQFVSEEMFLLPVQVATLTTFATPGGQTYGDVLTQDIKVEAGEALDTLEDEFILCGLTRGNLEQDVQAADPEDLYLVETDVDGLSGCENPWGPADATPTWTPACPSADVYHEESEDDADPDVHEPNSDNNVCIGGNRPDDCDWCKEARQPVRQRVVGTEQLFTMQVMPNPVPDGTLVRLNLWGGDVGMLEILVTDLIGREVYRTKMPMIRSTTTHLIPTEGWGSGTYTVRVLNGDRRTASTTVVIP